MLAWLLFSWDKQICAHTCKCAGLVGREEATNLGLYFHVNGLERQKKSFYLRDVH